MKINTIFTFLLLLTFDSIFSQTTMSLEDAIRFAQENHPSVRAAQLQISDADWRIKESTAGGLPQFSGELGYNYFFQKPESPLPAAFLPKDSLGNILPGVPRTASFVLRNTASAKLNYNQLLFSNSYRLAKKAARFYREYVQIQLESAKAALRNQVRDAYLPSLILSENVTILDKNIANLTKLRTETAAINKAGLLEQLDVDRLDLSISTLSSERENLIRQREIVIAALKFSMGFPQTDVLNLTDNLPKLLAEITDEKLPDTPDFSNRAEMKQLQKGIELSKLGTSIYEKAWLPTVAAFASYGYQALGDRLIRDGVVVPSGGIVGLSVGVPIWDGGQTKAKQARAKLGDESLQVQKKTVENAFAFEFQAAKLGLETAKNRLADAQKNVELAQKIYDVTEKKYKAGIGSSVEIVLSQQSLYSAQANILTAQFNVLTARVAAKKALGN
jgi:outer membrane protein